MKTDGSRKSLGLYGQSWLFAKGERSEEPGETCTYEAKFLEEIEEFRKSLICILTEIPGAFTAMKPEQEVMKNEEFTIREFRLKVKNTVVEGKKHKAKLIR